jgi:prepilin-type processing-associated H-X9-DG protein
MEGALDGFLTDSRAAVVRNGGIVMFSERDSEALNAPNNYTFGSIIQDDYDTWVGEAALVRWGTNAGPWSNFGWIRYNRHVSAANYVFIDGHGERRRWHDVRQDQFPDRVVRGPLTNPPQ